MNFHLIECFAHVYSHPFHLNLVFTSLSLSPPAFWGGSFRRHDDPRVPHTLYMLSFHSIDNLTRRRADRINPFRAVDESRSFATLFILFTTTTISLGDFWGLVHVMTWQANDRRVEQISTSTQFSYKFLRTHDLLFR